MWKYELNVQLFTILKIFSHWLLSAHIQLYTIHRYNVAYFMINFGPD